MNARPGSLTSRFRNRGFSVMEVLVTAAILSILLAVASSMAGSWRSQQILASATRLTQDLQLARSLAIKRGQPVELRFYSNKHRSLTTPEAQYKTWQIVGYDSREERYIKLSEVQRFESTVILSRFPILSSVITNERPLDPTRDPFPTALQTRMSAIEFRPDGSTTLDPDPSLVWTMTLLTDGFADQTNNLPPDFRTVIINPDNGSTSIY